MTTTRAALDSFIANIKKSQPKTTYKSYKSDLLGVTGFLASLSPTVKDSTPITLLSEQHAVKYLQSLLDRGLSANTRQRAAATLREFYRFASFTYNLNLSVDRLNYAIKSSRLLTGIKDVKEYPAEKIQRILDFTLRFKPNNIEDLRDLAFIWSLASTGLRVFEACNLKLKNIDNDCVVVFIGKGNVKATVRFGDNSRRFLRNYLKARATLDQAAGIQRENMPVFARHDSAVGKNKVKPINEKIGQKIVHRLTLLALGDEYDSKITCHTFRHYFITTVYEKSLGDMKLAQELARHADIRTTQRYTHRNKVANAEISKKIFG